MSVVVVPGGQGKAYGGSSSLTSNKGKKGRSNPFSRQQLRAEDDDDDDDDDGDSQPVWGSSFTEVQRLNILLLHSTSKFIARVYIIATFSVSRAGHGLGATLFGWRTHLLCSVWSTSVKASYQWTGVKHSTSLSLLLPCGEFVFTSETRAENSTARHVSVFLCVVLHV